jgi:uncharacterized BrkB/YihY/UPF0761 family membrane protein
VLTDAVKQAHEAGAQSRSLALTLGLVGAVVTGTTLLGQIERAMNRLYGVEQDRPTLKKYGRAFVLRTRSPRSASRTRAKVRPSAVAAS